MVLKDHDDGSHRPTTSFDIGTLHHKKQEWPKSDISAALLLDANKPDSSWPNNWHSTLGYNPEMRENRWLDRLSQSIISFLFFWIQMLSNTLSRSITSALRSQVALMQIPTWPWQVLYIEKATEIFNSGKYEDIYRRSCPRIQYGINCLLLSTEP